MSSSWRRWRALEPLDRRLSKESLRALLAVRTRLAVTSFDACLAWSRAVPANTRSDSAEPKRIARAVERAARFVPGSRCLAKALAARVLLRRRGLDPELCLGAGRDGDRRLVAHAWLELAGRVVYGDPEPGRFRPFDAVPGEPGTRMPSDPS